MFFNLLSNNETLVSSEYPKIENFYNLFQNGSNHDDESEVFFWDPPSAKNRSSKGQNHMRQLQEQLAQATVRIRDLEVELKRVQKVRY